MKKNISSFWLITIALVLVKLIIHFLTGTVYELHRDEMLYFAQGLHLNFGYISTPPLIGFLAFIVKGIFGYSEFGIKLFPALAGAASIVIIALFIKEFGGKNLALLIAGIGYLFSGAFLRSNSLFQPVSFDQFFWFLLSYLVFKMVNRDNPKIWIWTGLVFGLGFLNKYSIVFFAFAIIMALLISEHRKLLLSKYFLLVAFIGFILITPNLIWQYQHNWPVVHHMILLQQTQLINVSLTGFLVDQLVMCLPAILIWLSGLCIILFLGREKKYRFISYTFIFVVSIILLARGKSYYTLGAYPMLLVAGGYVLEKYFNHRLVYINYFILLFALVLSFIAFPLELPVASFATIKKYCDPQTGIPQRWEDGEIHPIPQDYADMTGWKELAGIVAKAYNQLDDSEKKRCTIYAENYGQAGAIQFYGHRYGLPDPVSFSDSYLLWAPDSIADGPSIYINDEVGDMDDLFISYQEIGRVNNEYFRENGIMVLLCTNPKEQWKKFYSRKVQMLKNNYSKRDECTKAIAIDAVNVIQAEDCCNSSGIQIEMTTDSEGGLNIGWIDADDWMEYKINLLVAGKYLVLYRIASLNGGGSISLSCNGSILETTAIQSTGGWQNWNTFTTIVNLKAGIQIIRFTAPVGGWNLNWWSISPVSGIVRVDSTSKQI